MSILWFKNKYFPVFFPSYDSNGNPSQFLCFPDFIWETCDLYSCLLFSYFCVFLILRLKQDLTELAEN
jgi:hypothetical protein